MRDRVAATRERKANGGTTLEKGLLRRGGQSVGRDRGGTASGELVREREKGGGRLGFRLRS